MIVKYHNNGYPICAQCGYLMEPDPIAEVGVYIVRFFCPNKECAQRGYRIRPRPLEAEADPDEPR